MSRVLGTIGAREIFRKQPSSTAQHSPCGVAPSWSGLSNSALEPQILRLTESRLAALEDYLVGMSAPGARHRGMPAANLAGTVDRGFPGSETSSRATSSIGGSSAPPVPSRSIWQWVAMSREVRRGARAGDARSWKASTSFCRLPMREGVEAQPLPDDMLYRLWVFAGMPESDFGRLRICLSLHAYQIGI